MFRKLSALAMIAALGLAIPTPAEAQGQTRAQKAAAAKAKKAESARKKAELKQSVAAFKQRLKVGKPALKRALADVKALSRQERDLRKRRLALKPAVDKTSLDQRANDNVATRTAYNNALAAYMPTRTAHENLIGQLQKAQNDLRQVRAFQFGATSQAKPRVINPITVEPGSRPRVDPRFVVDLNPTDVSVATSGGGLLGGTSAPRRTQAYGSAPQQGDAGTVYSAASFIPQQPPAGAQNYTSTAPGQQFRVRQNIYEQPGDPLN